MSGNLKMIDEIKKILAKQNPDEAPIFHFPCIAGSFRL
jgi:hypothetical protein